MFALLYPALSKRRTSCLSVSLVAHLLLLAWILKNPTPIFVAPSAVTRGEGGSTVTRIYFGGDRGVTQEHPDLHVSLPRPPQKKKFRQLAPPAPMQQAGNELTAAARPAEHPGGSPYGSLSYGSFFGLEVRPALPVVSHDPIVGPELLNGMVGDEIVEITIDRDGKIIEMRVLQSLGPQVDQKVLAALEDWHFAPATRNGVPIPSKQDVHYHFPR